MSKNNQVGARIRQARLRSGIRQSELARKAGISGSYLNLIEHDRRNIGGKLLADISSVLGIDPEILRSGTAPGVVENLKKTAAALAAPENAEGFAEAMPQWAEAYLTQHKRIQELETRNEALADRLANSPDLAASLHEMLSSVTAISSSAGILSDTPDIEPQWRARFQRNIFEDAERLVEGYRRLIDFLGPSTDSSRDFKSPREAFGAFLNTANHRFEAAESGQVSIEAIIAQAPELETEAARDLARLHLETAVLDAEVLPEQRLREAISDVGLDPVRLATKVGAPVSRVMRRLTATGRDMGAKEIGIARCDATGRLLQVRETDGFAMSRFGRHCTQWPLFLALLRPGVPVHRRLNFSGEKFDAYAICDLNFPAGTDGPTEAESTMILIPTSDMIEQTPPDACPICATVNCPSLRGPRRLGTL